MELNRLERLRPLGKLESISAACHHLEFFNNVGLSAHYRALKTTPALSLHQSVNVALADVICKHPILSAIPVDESTSSPYFSRLPYTDLNRSVTFINRVQSISNEDEADEELDALLQDQANINFKVDYGRLPFWRLVVLKAAGVDNEFTACFIYHHAIGDGISGLAFHSAFLEALRNTSTSAASISSTKKHLIRSSGSSLLAPLEELHPLPVPDLAANPPQAILKQWTGGPVRHPCSTRFRSLHITLDATKSFVQACKDRQLTVTAVLPALISRILFESLPFDIEALTCIVPVSLRPWLPRDVVNDSIGCWFDAFKVQLVRQGQNHQSSSHSSSSSMDIWPQAQETSKDIAKYLANTSSSGEPFATVAIFKSIPDVSPIFLSTIGNVRDAAFELSNLGVFPKATITNGRENGNEDTWQVGRVTFSRSAVVSGAALTLGAITGGDGRLSLGFTWQEGIIEDDTVDTMIAGIREYLETSP